VALVLSGTARLLSGKPLTSREGSSLPAYGDEPKQNDRDADERRRDRAYDLELQQLGLCHCEPTSGDGENNRPEQLRWPERRSNTCDRRGARLRNKGARQVFR
jgi:hypothetical protein